ncbi:MAG: hypothetical protein AAF596_09900 [Planctomycetota bacterium]
MRRPTRRCSLTGREFLPGEEFYSVLATVAGSGPGDQPEGQIERRDVGRESWQGPPADAIGWWLARSPDGDSDKPRLAPNEVLLDLFDRWGDDPTHADARYVLALLLIRRRVLKLASPDANGSACAESSLVVHCGSRDATYEVAVATPGEQRSKEIQKQLSDLLYTGCAGPSRGLTRSDAA